MRVTQELQNRQANILISYYDWQLFQILVITQPSLISINQMGIPTKSSKLSEICQEDGFLKYMHVAFSISYEQADTLSHETGGGRQCVGMNSSERPV